jgi:hypothetical protein
MWDKKLLRRNQQKEVSRRATPVARERNPTALHAPTRRHAPLANLRKVSSAFSICWFDGDPVSPSATEQLR